jgi:Fe-S-cluster containining protein
MKLKARAISGAKYLHFRCTDCGNCCTDTLVPLTHADVRRLRQGTGLPASAFLNFCKASEFADRAEGLAFIELEQGPRVMVLKRQYDLGQEREACYFFKDNRCTVYEHRPITCRNWPFDLTMDSSGRRLTRMAINKELPCPYELDGEPMKPSELIKTWKKDDAQDYRFMKVVDRWNDLFAGGTEAEFFAYLEKQED